MTGPFAGAPPERLARVRALVGAFAVVYVLVRVRYFADLSRHGASDFAPVGVARVLSAPLPPWTTTCAALVALVLGVLFVAGRRMRVVAPAFFLAMLWVTTYRSSFGKILHTENLLVLHLFVLAVSELLPPLRGPRAAIRHAGWTLGTMATVTACVYLVAGFAKLRFGGAGWTSGASFGDWLAWDSVRKIELGSVHSPLAAHVASSPGLLRAGALATLCVEIGAPLALLGPRAARAWAFAAFAFHAAVLVTMAIAFLYPLSIVAFAPALALERVRRWPRALGGAASFASERDAEG